MTITVLRARALATLSAAARQRRRTLARLSSLLIALLPACHGESPTDVDLAGGGDPAESAIASDPTTLASDLTPDFNVTSSALTNQPSGFTPIAEWAATSMMPLSTATTSGYGIVSGKWYRWYSSGGTTAYSASDAPRTSSGTLRFKFYKGMAPGGSYGMVQGWSTTSGTEYSRIYETGWVKIPSANFEMHGPSRGLKMFGFWAVGQKPSSANQLIGWTSGIGTNPVSSFVFELRQQNFVVRNLLPNVDKRALFTAGKWHRYEILMDINSIGSSNGKFQMWWNGIKTHHYTDVKYRTSTYPAKFYTRKWDPVWGGAGGSAKTRDDYLLVDHIYISGVK